MEKIYCKDLVIHFNKKHLEDQTVPPWVAKTAGRTFYVNHIESTMSWSTKETPDNSHTKGSIKFKKAMLTIDEENTAIIKPATMRDSLKKLQMDMVRVIYSDEELIEEHLATNGISHGAIVEIDGACGSDFHVTEISRSAFLEMRLSLPNDTYFRMLEVNEIYNTEYDRKINKLI